MLQVDLSEVEKFRVGSDRTGPGSIPVASGLLPVGPGASACVDRGFLSGVPGASPCVARGLLLVWSGVFCFMRRTLEVHNCFKSVSLFVIGKI